MRELPDNSGRFAVKLWFDDGEIDTIMEDELRRARMLPTADHPEVNIEAFVENRLGIVPDPVELPQGIMGTTRFVDGRPVSIFVQREIVDTASSSKVTERRLRSTLAHEGGGHALLHPALYVPSTQGRIFAHSEHRIDQMCRDINAAPGYSGEWWEYQANQAIGGILMPRKLFTRVLDIHLGSRGRSALYEDAVRIEVENSLSEAFNVSKEAVRYRLDCLKLVPPRGQTALALGG